MKCFIALAGLGLGVFAASFASAAPVTIQNFNSPGAQQTDPSQPFFLDAKYASWGAPFAVLTSEPNDFKVHSQFYGSGYKYLGPIIDAGTNDMLQVNFTVTEGVAGMLVDLVDHLGNGQSYRFYGLVPGGGTGGGNDYTFTVPFASGVYFAGTGVLDRHQIENMNIEIDPGPSQTFYTATFNDVSAVTIPEPAGLAVCAFACLLGARRRRS
jgi:hypothetical protein